MVFFGVSVCVGSWHEESTVWAYRGYKGKDTDKESDEKHFQFTTGWPRDADACAYLEVIKSLTSLLRRGERSPTHAHSLSQIHTRRDALADGLRRFSVTDWTMTFSLFSQLQMFTLVFLYPTFLSNSDRLG